MIRLATRLAIIGGGIVLSLSVALPAAAYVNCPAGFYYSYGYGCVPVSDGRVWSPHRAFQAKEARLKVHKPRSFASISGVGRL